jgi:hypothetical protein
MARWRGDLVVSSNEADLQRLADAVGRRLEIDHPDSVRSAAPVPRTEGAIATVAGQWRPLRANGDR